MHFFHMHLFGALSSTSELSSSSIVLERRQTSLQLIPPKLSNLVSEILKQLNDNLLSLSAFTKPRFLGYRCNACQAFAHGESNVEFSAISAGDISKEIISDLWKI